MAFRLDFDAVRTGFGCCRQNGGVSRVIVRARCGAVTTKALIDHEVRPRVLTYGELGRANIGSPGHSAKRQPTVVVAGRDPTTATVSRQSLRPGRIRLSTLADRPAKDRHRFPALGREWQG